MNKITPRVRFAPSPTGYLHIGGLRTALYNYLFAKHLNGKLILRIEDTDRKRFVEGAIENLIDTLNWAEIKFDEGPGIDGNFGPYLQSERLKIYKELVEKLVAEENAYYCFCTPERLEKLKEEQQKQKLPQAKYDKHCLNLNKSEVEEKLKSQIPFVIRLNVKPNQKIIFTDVIRESVQFDTENIDDQVLLKSDGYPTYHLANVVDDHLMGITHVIRGEEWLSSTPKHIILYDYFGWEKPVFAHLPLLLNPDKTKLSKRQGDVAVEDYRDKGYLKEALINFVALLGWNYGDDKEYYEMDELIEKFSLERVHKAGAVFNLEKLNWLNFEHLRRKPDDVVLQWLKEEIRKSELSFKSFSDDYLIKVISAMKERVSFVKEYLTKSLYFFEAPNQYEEQNLKKRWKEDSAELLGKLAQKFEQINNPSKEDYEKALDELSVQLNINKGKLVHPLRIAVSGIGEGPGVFDIITILGKEETLKRINTALQKLS
ncbi:MAG: glutamate--tRNA ligase [Ignavibacteriota bacterium]|nr:MAG: glutamate--tRNA ligase [Chlorobiota bacterium]MBE7477750.1 glutamate--tRNA ligase [Ignavibacteriales bacterium]MBL1123859.1 glutamate--tRNA ligase [Ignavibacteriota bacterium]MCE7855065.1 glutamate--tRNA ligase [Ignavibacteria bacterium CHB3]MEB2295750.1 glutamate--tRNA ligase [Ignavibacteria bacterium]NUM60531.1 glutamate--tRNA ligase [Ignavibacteriaceae bacterium]